LSASGTHSGALGKNAVHGANGQHRQ